MPPVGFNKKWAHVTGIRVDFDSDDSDTTSSLNVRVVNENIANYIARIDRKTTAALGIQKIMKGRYYDGTLSRSFNADEAMVGVTFSGMRIVGRAIVNHDSGPCFVFAQFLDQVPDIAIPESSGSHLFEIENQPSILHEALGAKAPARFMAASILNLIPEERERVLESNSLNSETKAEMQASLDEIEELLHALTSTLISEEAKATPDSTHQLERWGTKFKVAVERNIQSVVDAGNLGNAAVPITIILSCGALGSLLGGPVGFGAGSVFGHIITGQIKPGAAAKKLEDYYTKPDQDGD